MAVTCSFKKKFGSVTLDDGTKLTCFAGGNCWLVGVSRDKTYHLWCLQFFISDAKHNANMQKRGGYRDFGLKKAVLFSDLPNIGSIATAFARSGCVVTIKPRGNRK